MLKYDSTYILIPAITFNRAGHKPGLVKWVIDFSANPLRMEVITNVGFLRTSVLHTLLARPAIEDQKIGNNSATSSSTSAEQHQQPSSSRHRSHSKERQTRHAIKGSTKETTASARSARPRSRAVSREEVWERKTHVFSKTGSAHHTEMDNWRSNAALASSSDRQTRRSRSESRHSRSKELGRKSGYI
jgi:hypothetical protein